LDRILHELRAHAPARRTGAALLRALEDAQVVATGPVQGPACSFFASVDYVRAACWIGACLADALHYAHERGLIHFDLKPSIALPQRRHCPKICGSRCGLGSRLRAPPVAPVRRFGIAADSLPDFRASPSWPARSRRAWLWLMSLVSRTPPGRLCKTAGTKCTR